MIVLPIMESMLLYNTIISRAFLLMFAFGLIFIIIRRCK